MGHITPVRRLAVKNAVCFRFGIEEEKLMNLRPSSFAIAHRDRSRVGFTAPEASNVGGEFGDQVDQPEKVLLSM